MPQIFPQQEAIAVRDVFRCGGCDKAWTGKGRAHCSKCHDTYAGASGFDSHIRKDTHLRPADVKPALELRDGLWRSTETRPAGSWS